MDPNAKIIVPTGILLSNLHHVGRTSIHYNSYQNFELIYYTLKHGGKIHVFDRLTSKMLKLVLKKMPFNQHFKAIQRWGLAN